MARANDRLSSFRLFVGGQDFLRVRTDDLVGPDFRGDGTFGTLPQGNAGNLQGSCFLLYTPGVGEHDLGTNVMSPSIPVDSE